MKKLLSVVIALILPISLMILSAPVANAAPPAGYKFVKRVTLYASKPCSDVSLAAGQIVTKAGWDGGTTYCDVWQKLPASSGTTFTCPRNLIPGHNAGGAKTCLSVQQAKSMRRARTKHEKRPTENDNGGTANAEPSAGDVGPPVVLAQPIDSVLIAPTPEPKGNIIITTCLKADSKQERCDKDHRLGKVRVKVERVDGAENCDNRTHKVGLTNQQTSIKRNGKDVTVKGTIHYIGCDTGKYRVSVVDASLKDSRVGRKGYRLVAGSHNPKEFTLSDNENQHIFFVLEKGTVK